jgi:hypothetical protein
MVEHRLTKIDAAVEQLDWAIRLFLDHQAYVPAITLGGAANLMLHEMLGSKSPLLIAADTLASQDGSIKRAWKTLHKAMNWLKHWQGGREETLSLEWEIEAFQNIVARIENVI